MTSSTIEQVTADPEMIRRALLARYTAAPGLIAVCSTRNWAGAQSADLDELVDWVLREDRAGAEGIYTRVTTVREPFPSGRRGGAADTHGIVGMWSDIDFGDGDHAAEGLPTDAAAAREIPRAARLPEPTRVEHSGGGLYAWWALATPAVVGEHIDYDQARRLSSDWQDILGTGAAALGLTYGTGVKDLARVLRLPGTVNRKPGRRPALARTIETGGPTYDLAELIDTAARLNPLPARPVAAVPPARSAPRPRQHHGRPGPLEILGNHPAVPDILSQFGATYGQQASSCPMCAAGECQAWLRPGWTRGSSMSGISVHKGGHSVTVRSDNAGMPAGGLNRVLSPGQLFAWLHHGGDESAAATDILRAAHGHASASAAAAALPTAILEEIRAVGRDQATSLQDVRAQTRRPPAPPTAGTAALQEPDPDPDEPPDDYPVDDELDRPGESAPPPAVGFDFTVFGLPDGVRTPDNYRIYRGGVAIKRAAKDEGKDTWIRFAFAPLVVTAAFEDPAGEQCVELAWTDRGKVVRRIVSREVAKRGRELVKVLGSAGLPVVEGDARVAERWLAEFESANLDLIPYEPLARYLGWQPDGSFLASADGGAKLDVVYDEQRAPARAHTTHGTLDAWRTVIQGLEAYPVPRVALAAALGATLLRPLGVNSFTFDISSRSTKGKTTALQTALSVWANPSEQSDAMSNWRTTLYAIEKRLNLVRGMLVVLDETMAVSDETLIDQVLYQLPMNHGKARSGGAFGNMLPWETILMCSGERPALSFTTSQGAAARILGTTLAPFGNGGGETAVKTRDGVLANYGWAGPAFAEMLRAGLARDGGLERLKARHAELKDAFKGDSDMTGRRAPMVALLALAEELACKARILPYAALPADTWRRLFSANNPTDNRPEMAMDVVRGYVAGHSAELWVTGKSTAQDKPPYAGWLGIASPEGTALRVAILPERLRRILSDAGYSLDSVVDSWIEANYLETKANQRPAHLINRRIGGGQAKVFCFTTAAVSLRTDLSDPS